jgi:hypothetical protein
MRATIILFIALATLLVTLTNAHGTSNKHSVSNMKPAMGKQAATQGTVKNRRMRRRGAVSNEYRGRNGQDASSAAAGKSSEGGGLAGGLPLLGSLPIAGGLLG